MFSYPVDERFILPTSFDPTASPKIQWHSDHLARFQIGDFMANVEFYIQNRRRCRGWWPVSRVYAKKTGLFRTAIDPCLRTITEKFMKESLPPSLFVYGDDAKRNDWNSKHYGDWNVGDCYRFFVIKNPKSFKKNSRDVVGVGWVREGQEIDPREFNHDGDKLEWWP